jgi:hypothetical protein
MILEAFADTTYPGRSRVCASIECYDELEEMLIHDQEWNNDWRNIPKKLVSYNYSGLSFCSDVGYQFFLPIYMLLAIDQSENDYTDLILMTVIYNLCCHNDPRDECFDYHCYQQNKLTARQKEVICCFLEFIFLDVDDEDYDNEYCELIKKTLDSQFYGISTLTKGIEY